jgi:hypothetical protein
MPLSLKEVRELLLSLWPPGQLYDWYTPTSNVSRYLDTLAETLKTFAFDIVDRLRREINPASAVEKLPDWEDALGIADSHTARDGTVAQRRGAVIGKLREFGAFTLSNTRAIVAPLLGYADASKLAVLEVDRAQMRAAHSYTDGKSHSGSFFLVAQVYVPDGGTVSKAGVQLAIQLSAAPSSPMSVGLQSPAGKLAIWSSEKLGPPGTDYNLYAPDFTDGPCNGVWTLIMVQLSLTEFTIASWSIFVEGAGRSGLGGDIVDWGVYLDPALAGANGTPPDLDATDAAMSRIEHAHTSGYLIFSLSAIPDDPRSLPDACLPG